MAIKGTGIQGDRSCLPGGTENLPGYCRTELMTAAFKMNGCFYYLEMNSLILMCANANL